MKKLAAVSYSPEYGYVKQDYNPETSEFFSPESTTKKFFNEVWENNPDKRTELPEIKVVTLW